MSQHTLHSLYDVELSSAQHALGVAHANLDAQERDENAACDRLARFDAVISEQMAKGIDVAHLRLASDQRRRLLDEIQRCYLATEAARRRVSAAQQEVAAKRLAFERPTRRVPSLRQQLRAAIARRKLVEVG